MLMTPLIKPRPRNTLRHDFKAARIVGCIVADAALNLETSPGNEARAALGPMRSNFGKTKLRKYVSTERQRSANRETKSADILAVAQGFQFDHRLPVLMTQG